MLTRLRGICDRPKVGDAPRIPWLVAVGVVAASLADPLVESLANAGLFGGGYADNDHAGVFPALAIGILLVSIALAIRARTAWNRSSERGPDRFVEIARSIAGASPRRDLPAIYLTQIATLFAIESAEQFLATGRLALGIAWLGAPIPCALALHALVGAACLFAIAYLARALVRTLATLLRAVSILRSWWLAIARVRPQAMIDERRRTPRRTYRAPHARATRGRAPPRLLRIPA